MLIKKTVGLPYKDGERKGYTIHTTCGEAFIAAPHGLTGWQCEGMKFKTLSAVKDSISNDELGYAPQDTTPDEQSTLDGVDTWDCVHPCAWLCIVTTGCKETLETLGNYGWLDCMGRPDIARAEREIKRVENFRKGN